MTYEDVTNIDSLGLGTFRNGLIVQGTGTTSTTLNVSGVSTFTGTTNHTHANISRSTNGTALELRNTSTSNSAYVDQRFVIDGQSRAGFRGQIHGANLGGQLRFYTAADTQVLTERAVIDHQGRFGINQSSPAYTLDLGESSSTIRLVSENFGTAIRVGAGGSNDVTLIRIDGDSSNHDGESNSAQYGFSLKYLGSGTGNANAFAIFSDNQTGTQVQAFTVLQDGTVGINSTIPSERLDVGGTTKTEQLNVSGISTFSGDISIADKIIHTGDTNTAIRFPADDTFTIETAGSERLRIDSGGDIFINRTSQLTNAKVSVQADSGQALIAGQMNTNSGTSTVLQTYAASAKFHQISQ